MVSSAYIYVSFFFFNKAILFNYFKKQRETQLFCIYWLTSQTPATVRVRPVLSQEPRAQPRLPTCVPGSKYLNKCRLVPRVPINRKLALEQSQVSISGHHRWDGGISNSVFTAAPATHTVNLTFRLGSGDAVGKTPSGCVCVCVWLWGEELVGKWLLLLLTPGATQCAALCPH